MSSSPLGDHPPFAEFIDTRAATDVHQVQSAFVDYESSARSAARAQIADYAALVWQQFDKRMSAESEARDCLLRQLADGAQPDSGVLSSADMTERTGDDGSAAGGAASAPQRQQAHRTSTGPTNQTGRDTSHGSASTDSAEPPQVEQYQGSADDKSVIGATITSQDNRRWSDATQLTGTDSAVPPSPFSLMSRPSPQQLDDLDESVLFDDGTSMSTPRHRLRNVTDSGDEADSDDSGNYEERGDRFENHVPQRQRTRHSGRSRLRQANSADVQTNQEKSMGAGKLALGSSLPVTIPAKYWPPKEAYDSPRDFDSDDVDEFGYTKQPANVFLPHRAAKNHHELIVEISRSIQPADDPERLFGERPNRRRYATGEQGNGPPSRHVPDMPSDLFMYN